MADEWDKRVLEFGGVREAVDEKIEQWELEVVIDTRSDYLYPTDHLTDYEIFLRCIVTEDFFGGGMSEGSANRVLAFKTWRWVVSAMEIGENAWRVQEMADNVFEGLDREIAKDWGKWNGLSLF